MTRVAGEMMHDAGEILVKSSRASAGEDEPRPPSTSVDAAHVAWPPDRFFWAILDTPGLSRHLKNDRSNAGLDLLFADEVPIPIDAVCTVYTRLDTQRILGCAVHRSDLAEIGPDAVTLRPVHIPAWIEQAPHRAEEMLNLLVRDFEPRSVRRARGHLSGLIVASILIASLLVTVGLRRRIAALDSGAAARQQAAADLLAQAMPDEAPSSVRRLHHLRERLAVLRQTNLRGTDAAPDAALSLATLLRGWPDDPAAHVEVLSITPDRLSMSVSLEDDPSVFISRLRPPEGWNQAEPRISRGREHTTVEMEFHRSETP